MIEVKTKGLSESANIVVNNTGFMTENVYSMPQKCLESVYLPGKCFVQAHRIGNNTVVCNFRETNE